MYNVYIDYNKRQKYYLKIEQDRENDSFAIIENDILRKSPGWFNSGRMVETMRLAGIVIQTRATLIFPMQAARSSARFMCKI